MVQVLVQVFGFGFEKPLLKFNRGFRPLMARLDRQSHLNTSFGGLFETFVDYIKEHFQTYEWEFEAPVRDKLVRHMDATATPAPIELLLNSNLRRYHLYREPDLIMDDDVVVVSTVHRAKGFEFDTVIIPSAVENTYPFYWAVELGGPEEIAEEARIFYVGLTRAKQRLIVTEHEFYMGIGRPRWCRTTRFLNGLTSHFNGG